MKLLYRSLDEELQGKEKTLLEEALGKSAELRRERERLLEQRRAITEGPRPGFRASFADRVMSRLDSLGERKNGLEAFYESLLMMFRRFALAGALLLLLLLLYNWRVGDVLSSEEMFYASDGTIQEILDLPLF